MTVYGTVVTESQRVNAEITTVQQRHGAAVAYGLRVGVPKSQLDWAA